MPLSNFSPVSSFRRTSVFVDFFVCSSANLSDERQDASGAVVAPLQRLIATDLAAVLVAPVTPGLFHRLSSSRDKSLLIFS